jgi:hypothetical protein
VKVTKEVIQQYVKFLGLPPASRETSEYHLQMVMNTKLCPTNPLIVSISGQAYDAKVEYEKIGPVTWTATCSAEMRYLDFLLETQKQNLQVAVEAVLSIVRALWLEWLGKLHRAIKKLDKSAKLPKKYRGFRPDFPTILAQLQTLNQSIANDLSKFAFSSLRSKLCFESTEEDPSLRKAIRSQNFMFCRAADPVNDPPTPILDFCSKWFESKRLTIMEKLRFIHAALVIQRGFRSRRRS